jgi:hypothetical protein
MTQITITVNDEVMEQLLRVAHLRGITAAEMASTLVNDYTRKELFRDVLQCELTKNAELYRRLARGPEGD